MKTFKLLLSVLISFSLFGCAAAQIKKTKTIEKNNKKIEKTNDKTTGEKMPDKSMNGELKVLSEGAYSEVEQPFVFAARSNETYAQLQNFVQNLPPATDIDFSKTAIVAAFAGTKNSGGYAVSMKSSAGKILIGVSNPPKDAMVTQVITAPFQIALVPLEEDNSLNLELSENWRKALQIYRISSGTFEYSGGLSGRRKEFSLEGTVSVISFGNNATIIFNLSGKGTEKMRKLTETASGSMKDGKIDFARLDAGSFLQYPKVLLKVSGETTNNKLSLIFEPLPSYISDSFEGRGKIEAVKVR